MKISELSYNMQQRYNVIETITIWRLCKDRLGKSNSELYQILSYLLHLTFDDFGYDEYNDEFILYQGDIEVVLDKKRAKKVRNTFSYLYPNQSMEKVEILKNPIPYIEELKDKMKVTKNKNPELHPGSCLRMSTAGTVRTFQPKERNNFLG